MHEEHGVFPGVYPGQYHPVPHFRQFLDLANSKGCLPPSGHWSAERLKACETLAARMDGDGPCIFRPLVMSELVQRYGQRYRKVEMAVNPLRLVAKGVYGGVADRPKDAHVLEGLSYVCVNGQWGLGGDETRHGDIVQAGLKVSL